MVGGLLTGAASGFLVRKSWAAISGKAVFAATNAAINRLGALGFRRTTGVWPGD